MNGYGDIFTDAELARNFRMDGTDPGWVADVKGTGARYALLKTGIASSPTGCDTLEGWDGDCSAATRSCCSKPPTTGRRPTRDSGRTWPSRAVRG